MKARKALSVFSFLALAALLLTLTSCPASIYYTLENEVKTTDNTLSNDLWMHGMARIGTDYYLAAGKVWQGHLDADDCHVGHGNPAHSARCQRAVQHDRRFRRGAVRRLCHAGRRASACTRRRGRP